MTSSFREDLTPEHQLFVFDNFFCRTKSDILWIADRTDALIFIKINVREIAKFAKAMTTCMQLLVGGDVGTASFSTEFKAGTKIYCCSSKVTFQDQTGTTEIISDAFDLACIIRAVSCSLPFLYGFNCNQMKMLKMISVEDCLKSHKSIETFFEKMLEDDNVFEMASKIKRRYKYMNETDIYIFLDYYISSEELKSYFTLHFTF